MTINEFIDKLYIEENKYLKVKNKLVKYADCTDEQRNFLREEKKKQIRLRLDLIFKYGMDSCSFSDKYSARLNVYARQRDRDLDKTDEEQKIYNRQIRRITFIFWYYTELRMTMREKELSAENKTRYKNVERLLDLYKRAIEYENKTNITKLESKDDIKSKYYILRVYDQSE